MFHNKHAQEQLRTLVFREIQQAQEEGKDLSLLDLTAFSSKDLESYSTEELQDYYNALLELPISASFEFEEPTSWKAIENACVGFHNSQLSHGLDEAMLFNKIYGGILGRSCGCTLGDPFPSGVIGPNNETGYELLKNYLKGADAWPLTNYLPGVLPTLTLNCVLLKAGSRMLPMFSLMTIYSIRYSV